MSGAKRTVRPRHDRICAVCLVDLGGTVIVLPCNHPLHDECHSNMFKSYEERLREFHKFYENPYLDITAVDCADIPARPARVCCPFSCPKELDRTDGKPYLSTKIVILNLNRKMVKPKARKEKSSISVKGINEGGSSSNGRKRKNRKKISGWDLIDSSACRNVGKDVSFGSNTTANLV